MAAVEPKLNSLTLAANDVIIPPILLGDLRLLSWRRTGEQFVPAFVVKAAPEFGSDIGLVANHLVVIRNPSASYLNPGVDAFALQLKIQRQLKIIKFRFVSQEEVVRNSCRRHASWDRMWLHWA